MCGNNFSLISIFSDNSLPDYWNVTILKLMASSVMQEKVSDVKKWKINLLTVINTSSKIENEVCIASSLFSFVIFKQVLP